MKAIMMSIRPRFIADILNRKKTIEIRKSIPKCELPIDVYIYCTKNNGCIGLELGTYKMVYLEKGTSVSSGKVVAKFTLNKAEEIKGYYDEFHREYVFENEEICEKSCLNEEELGGYLKIYNNNDYQVVGYAWHINNLEIFDEPRELYEFKVSRPFTYTNGLKSFLYYPLTKAPESYCYVEIENE